MIMQEISYIKVDEKTKLDLLIDSIRSLTDEDFISLDTEFVRINTLFPILGLLQLRFKNETYLVDPVALNIKDLVRTLTETKAAVLIFSGDEDLEILVKIARDNGFASLLPQKVYDLQLLAAFDDFLYGKGLNAYVKELVGAELEKYLKHYGYNVIHDTTIYDSSYSQSYDRSLKGVAKLLEENKDTDILFDIHRDAIGDSSYAPTVKIGDDEAAQLMFVIGSNGGGSEHDNWNENLKLAIKIQEKANELYPGLFKPIVLRDSRYNQQLAKGASIIEVGATGNTMEQALTSMKYLANVLNEVLK